MTKHIIYFLSTFSVKISQLITQKSFENKVKNSDKHAKKAY